MLGFLATHWTQSKDSGQTGFVMHILDNKPRSGFILFAAMIKKSGVHLNIHVCSRQYKQKAFSDKNNCGVKGKGLTLMCHL